MQEKKQLIDQQEHSKRYCNVSLVFSFDSANYDTNLSKSSLLSILIETRDIEPVVNLKSNQYMSFRFGGIQILDIMNILGGAKSFDSFLKT